MAWGRGGAMGCRYELVICEEFFDWLHSSALQYAVKSCVWLAFFFQFKRCHHDVVFPVSDRCCNQLLPARYAG
ncbi:hypothetical protein CW304_02180 [Bacillus sp. UFRGS-B20]|nr:hypothetical protein CW304_02180 [Bacillus sp. UFRGS-B20]